MVCDMPAVQNHVICSAVTRLSASARTSVFSVAQTTVVRSFWTWCGPCLENGAGLVLVASIDLSQYELFIVFVHYCGLHLRLLH